MKETLEILIKMLVSLTILYMFMAMIVYIFSYSMTGLTVSEATGLQYGPGNFTSSDLKSDNFVDIFSDQCSKRLQIFGSALVSSGV